MADILIRGMEMPDSCSYCPMCYDMIECTVSPLQFWHGRPENEQFDFCNERHPLCPLIELPPHGDLIDRDALIQTCNEIIDEDWNAKAAPYSWSYAYESFVDDVEAKPVVIPSNKEEST